MQFRAFAIKPLFNKTLQIMNKQRILIGIAVLAVAIQFIRPAKNQSEGVSANDITKHYDVPADVQKALKVSCYDCHSNNTTYPWYSNIQPVGWWLNHHVEEGKDELNFSEFASYAKEKAAHKLEEVAEAVTDHWMPLDSYTWIHKDAILSDQDSKAIATWAKALQDSLAK